VHRQVYQICGKFPSPVVAIHKQHGRANDNYLKHQYRKDMRIMVQETFNFQSADPAEGCTGHPANPPSKTLGCKNRDAATFESLTQTLNIVEQPYLKSLRNYLSDLNAQTASNFSTVVPIWEASLRLRQCGFSFLLPKRGITLTHLQ
jgi:hypothetical protein